MGVRRLVTLVVSVACVAGGQPGLRAGASAAETRVQVPGTQQPPVAVNSALSISGTVLRRDGTTTVADVPLQLRNLDKGTIVGNTVSDKNGAFAFTVSEPGLYVVEAVGKNDGVVAVGDPVSVVQSSVISNVILQSNIAGMLLILSAAAGGAGLVGWVAAGDGTDTAVVSPER